MWAWAQEQRQRTQRLKQDWRATEWLAVDLETNGLDADANGILSMAWVALNSKGIRLASADYHVIWSEQPLNQSVIHHGLTEQDIARGETLAAVMPLFAQALEGRILVAHHAAFDWQLLQQAAQLTDVDLNPLAVLDTLQLERSRQQARYQQLHCQGSAMGAYTLAACRRPYALPDKPQHHALEDAMACAELFLVQAWQIGGQQPLSAGQLVRRSRRPLRLPLVPLGAKKAEATTNKVV
ncbi:MAG: exonuclease domain-containing protein [Natronospirillum sp.]